jgi:putative ABC transport system permease protein
MRRLRSFLFRLADLFGRAGRDRDLAAELDSHLQLHIDDNLRAGMTPSEARRNARMTLGGLEQTKERYRDRRGFPAVGTLGQDVRYGARILRRNPGFTVAAVTTMALGIGANSAMFTVINVVLLRPLPYPDSDRLVSAVQFHAKSGPEWTTWPDYMDWRDQPTGLQRLGGAWQVTYNLTGIDEPERLSGAAVTASLFPVLGVAPSLGRVFSERPDEDPLSVVLAHSVWRRRFAADDNVIGRTIDLNGRPHTVIGVMPDGFAFPPQTELWVPFDPSAPGLDRGYHLLNVVGRLKAGATIDQVRGELGAVAARSAREFPATNRDWGVQVSSLLDGAVGSTRPALLILAAAVGCVLLIACANVAALLMSRAAVRSYELTLRAALGASRGRIARQLLTESLMLAICGGAAGLALAAAAVNPLLALTTLPRSAEVSLDPTVLLFTLLVSVITGVGFGLAPALMLSRSAQSPTPGIRVSVPTGSLRPALVALEVALSVVLLVGAGLLIRSFHRLQQVEPGFSADRMITMRFFLPRAAYPVDRAIRHYQQMIERVSGLPDVDAAAVVSHFPFSGLSAGAAFRIPGRPPAAAGDGVNLNAEFRSASPGYFRAMGIPLLMGRDFSEADAADAPLVAIVNRAMADRFFPGQNPLDQSVQILGPKPRRIVGIVQNVRHRGLDSALDPEIYVPHPQQPLGGMFLAVRARSGDPARLVGAVRAEVRALDRNLPISSIRTSGDLLGDTLSRRRFILVLLTIFAASALALSIIGVYGVLSFAVAQRTREIGIRMALGAASRDVLRLTLGQGMRPVLGGLLIGIVAALAATRVLTGMLYEIGPTDPPTLAGVVVLLLGAALAATLIPARRAARVDPMVTLRHE